MLDLLNLYQFSKQILALHLCRFFVFSKTFIISDMGAFSLKPFSFLGVCDLGIGMMFEVFQNIDVWPHSMDIWNDFSTTTIDNSLTSEYHYPHPFCFLLALATVFGLPES